MGSDLNVRVASDECSDLNVGMGDERMFIVLYVIYKLLFLIKNKNLN